MTTSTLESLQKEVLDIAAKVGAAKDLAEDSVGRERLLAECKNDWRNVGISLANAITATGDEVAIESPGRAHRSDDLAHPTNNEDVDTNNSNNTSSNTNSGGDALDIGGVAELPNDDDCVDSSTPTSPLSSPDHATAVSVSGRTIHGKDDDSADDGRRTVQNFDYVPKSNDSLSACTKRSRKQAIRAIHAPNQEQFFDIVEGQVNPKYDKVRSPAKEILVDHKKTVGMSVVTDQSEQRVPSIPKTVDVDDVSNVSNVNENSASIAKRPYNAVPEWQLTGKTSCPFCDFSCSFSRGKRILKKHWGLMNAACIPAMFGYCLQLPLCPDDKDLHQLDDEDGVNLLQKLKNKIQKMPDDELRELALERDEVKAFVLKYQLRQDDFLWELM